MPTPTFYYPPATMGKEELQMYLIDTINNLNNILLSLDEKNTHHFNYIPLRSDGGLGSATPQAGWVRAIQSSGVTNLQYYSTAWVTLMKFSTAYQTNSAGGHLHSFTVPDHTHSFSGTASTETGAFSGITDLDGTYTGNTSTSGAHIHVLITT